MEQKDSNILNLLQASREALKILDQNTVQYMIEQQQQELDEIHEELAMVQDKLSDTQSQLTDSQSQLSEAQSQLLHAQETIEKTICSIVTLCRDLGKTKETAITQLQEKLQLNPSDAETAVQKYWQ